MRRGSVDEIMSGVDEDGDAVVCGVKVMEGLFDTIGVVNADKSDDSDDNDGGSEDASDDDVRIC